MKNSIGPATVKSAFILVTLTFGVAFTFFTGDVSVQSSILYNLTILRFGTAAASAWGITALVVAVGTVAGIWFKRPYIGEPVTALGFLLWCYALCLYIISGFWFQVFAAAVPNLLWWGWYYISVRRYHQDG